MTAATNKVIRIKNSGNSKFTSAPPAISKSLLVSKISLRLRENRRCIASNNAFAIDSPNHINAIAPTISTDADASSFDLATCPFLGLLQAFGRAHVLCVDTGRSSETAKAHRG
eukprot:TRINITY_DN6360_c0_g1_i1.p2 TRINITY_DN6360_c0_g1~~TRINITY_DN6360_c0_g1_i1.p2  ORF type:complete len:113 (+),score=28.87 TRINITY_DN6360_c0_g1_i1:216-554(+)